VDTSLYGSLIWLQGVSVAMQLALGTGPPRTDRAKAGNPLFNHYRCQDGKWLVLSHLQSDRYWSEVCRALGMEDLERDPKFENMEVRAKNAAEIISIMDDIFASKPRDEWLRILAEAEDLCFEPISTLAEMVSDPQVLQNNYITDFEHPVWGAVKALGHPMKFSKTPAAIQREAPEFGQHTEEILTEILGYSWDDIARLQDIQVI
jgi:crotonobetainyl-CoA:carnitine CoA-transferase CaiB-like acyl-CoA transferase